MNANATRHSSGLNWAPAVALCLAAYGLLSYAARMYGTSGLLVIGTVPIRANAAICLTLSSAALWLELTGNSQSTRSKWARGLALAALCIAGATLIEHLLDLDLGIDELLLREGPHPDLPNPGRIPFPATVILSAISIAVLTLRRLPTISQLAAITAGSLCIVVLVGTVFSSVKSGRPVAYFGVTIPGPVILFVLANVILASRLNIGLFADWNLGKRPFGAASFVLYLLVAVVSLGWYVVRDAVATADSAEFYATAASVRANIEERLAKHEAVLVGATAFLTETAPAKRNAWRKFVERIDIGTLLPGIQGLGYATLIKPADLQEHIRSVRAEGFPNYTVWPDGRREAYTSIVFLEPFKGRNLRAFGYDMFSEPIRHAAMVRAMDTGRLSVSGRVTLVQETGRDVQPGFLLYFPLYRADSSLESTADRRLGLLGFTYSPVRARDFFDAALGKASKDVMVEIFDGDSVEEDALLYRRGEALRSRHYTVNERMRFGGHDWTLYVHAEPASAASRIRSQAPTVLGLAGAIIGALMLGLVFAFSRSRSANASLAARIQDLSKFAESTPGATFIRRLNPDGSVSVPYASAKFFDIYGLRPEDIAQDASALYARVHPAEHARFEQSILDSAKDLSPFHIEFRYQHPQKGEIWLESWATATREPDGATLWHGLTFDVTERKRAEADLRQRTEDLAGFAESTPGAVFAFQLRADGTRCFSYASKRFLDVFGVQPQDVREDGTPVLAGIHRDDLALLKQHKDESAQNETLWHEEFRYIHPVKGQIWIESWSMPSRQPDGSILWRGVAFDVTRRKHAEADLAQSVDALARSNVELQRVAYLASHDLQTPLRAITGFTQLLQSSLKGNSNPEVLDWIARIVRNSRYMQQMILNLLDYARVDYRARPFEPVELTGVCTTALEMLEPSIRSAGAQVRVESLPSVLGDESQLVQLFQNLIANALNFCAEKAPEIVVSAEETVDEYIVSVRDNGIGIEPGQTEKIFEMFHRLHTGGEYPGTGMGLAICRRIVGRHGGRIWAESVLGCGSAFRFSLPRVQK